MSYFEKRNQIDALKAKIDAFGELSPEVKKTINYKFRLDWNYYSNSMEGNTLTKQETRSVMIGNIKIGNGEKSIKEIMEMRGHDKIVLEILEIGKGIKRISEKKICEIHELIMYEENDADKKKIGKWKVDANEIINYRGEKFEFIPPSEVPEKIHELLNKTNAAIDSINKNGKDAPHPLDIALQFHLDFVTIHPFYDGNGRVARILTNLLLISFGYPPFWIKKEEEDIYKQYIADIQGYGGNSDLFFEFATGLILRSQQLVLDAIEGRSIEEEDDYIKEIKQISKKLETVPPPKSPKLVYEIFEQTEQGLWRKISSVLASFDELFNEKKTTRYVNWMDERFKTIKTPNSLAALTSAMYKEVSTKPKEPEIFGYNIYENEIDEVKWKHIKYGLRGSKAKDFEIDFGIYFHTETYKINMKLNKVDFAQISKHYNDVPTSDEEELMISKLKEEFLKAIRAAVNDKI